MGVSVRPVHWQPTTRSWDAWLQTCQDEDPSCLALAASKNNATLVIGGEVISAPERSEERSFYIKIFVYDAISQGIYREEMVCNGCTEQELGEKLVAGVDRMWDDIYRQIRVPTSPEVSTAGCPACVLKLNFVSRSSLITNYRLNGSWTFHLSLDWRRIFPDQLRKRFLIQPIIENPDSYPFMKWPKLKISVALYAQLGKDKDGHRVIKEVAEEAAVKYQTWSNNSGKKRWGYAIPIRKFTDVRDETRRIVANLKPVPIMQFVDGHIGYGTREVEIEYLALFSHGLQYSMGLNEDNSHRNGLHTEKCGGSSNVESFVSTTKDVFSEDIQVLLFACLTGGDSGPLKEACEYDEIHGAWNPPLLMGQHGGVGTLADRLVKALHDVGKHKAVVLAHTTAGHVSDNFAARQFRFDGAVGGGVHIFDLIYDKDFLAERPKGENRYYHAKVGPQVSEFRDMWTHYRCSVNLSTGERDYKEKDPKTGKEVKIHKSTICTEKNLDYHIPKYKGVRIGLEMFFRLENAKTLLQLNWNETHPLPQTPKASQQQPGT